MKKALLFTLSLFIGGVLIAQDCSDILISEYVEGWRNNKSIEIYNPTPEPIELGEMYRLIRWSNGDEAADQDFRYVLPLEGTIDAYDVMVIIQDTLFPGQDTMVYPGLRQKATWLAPADYDANTQGCRVVFWNGDDAISLQKNVQGNWLDIDIFGEIGVRPLNWQGGTSPAGAWVDTPPYADGQGAYLTKDQTLVRHSDVLQGIDRSDMDEYGTDSFYAFAEYDSLSANDFDSLGFHRCECQSLGIDDTDITNAVKIFPNPVQGNKFEVKANRPIKKIELFNVAGQVIYADEPSLPAVRINLKPNQHKGIYIIKLKFSDNSVLTRKIILN